MDQGSLVPGTVTVMKLNNSGICDKCGTLFWTFQVMLLSWNFCGNKTVLFWRKKILDFVFNVY